MSVKLIVRLLSFVVVILLWEYFGRRINPILFTYPTAVAQAFVSLVASGELQSYMTSSLLVLAYASILAIVVGVLFGVDDGPILGGRMGRRYLYQRALFNADGRGRTLNRFMVWL